MFSPNFQTSLSGKLPQLCLPTFLLIFCLFLLLYFNCFYFIVSCIFFSCISENIVYVFPFETFISFSLFPLVPVSFASPCLSFFSSLHVLLLFHITGFPYSRIFTNLLKNISQQNKQTFKEIFQHVSVDLMAWGMVVTDGELTF